MQGILKKTDIDQAQRNLQRRRREILLRHAEEAQSLDAERAELDTLYHLIDVFTQKFPKPVVFVHQPVAAPVVHQTIASKAAAVAGHQRHAAHHMSNFAQYTRAMARA